MGSALEAFKGPSWRGGLSLIDAVRLVFNAEVMMAKCGDFVFVEEGSIFMETPPDYHKQSDRWTLCSRFYCSVPPLGSHIRFRK